MIFAKHFGSQQPDLAGLQQAGAVSVPSASDIPANELQQEEPGLFDGVGRAAVQGVQSALLETTRVVQSGVSGFLEENFEDNEAVQKYAEALDYESEKNRVLIRDLYTPDPAVSGEAATIVYGVTNGLTKYAGALAMAGGNPVVAAPLFGAGMGAMEAQKMMDEGVDKETATKVGMVTGVTNAFWSAVPGFIGTRLVTRAASGSAAAAFSTYNERATIETVLQQADYSKVAEQYDPDDPTTLATSAILGLAPGVAMSVGPRWKGRGVTDVKVEDAARVRAEEVANDDNLLAAPERPDTVQRSRNAQREVERQLNAKEPVRVPEEAVTPERVESAKKDIRRKLSSGVGKHGNVLQNRDRSSKESVVQMNSIAGAPDYGRLGFSRSFSQGAPIVAYAQDIPETARGLVDFAVDANGKRYEVQYAVVEADSVATSNYVDGTPNPLYGEQGQTTAIAGNGRIAGLTEAYNRDTAGAYRAELEADAMPGIDKSVLAGMEKPILVRIMRDDDVTADIGDISNRSDAAQLSPIEVAIQDGNRFDLANLTFTEDGNVGVDAVAEFLRALPAEERSSLITDGIPNDAARRRLDAAIFQRAYKNAGLTDLLDNRAEAKGVVALLSALRQVAPKVIQIEDADELNFGGILSDVLEEVRMARASGKVIRIEDIAAQTSMSRSPEADVVLQFLAKNEQEKGGTRGIVNVLSQWADFARENAASAQSDNMFGDAFVPTRRDLMVEFSRLSGVEIDEKAFMPARNLSDVVKRERADRAKQAVLDEVSEEAGIPPIEPAPRMSLIEVARDADGTVHRVYGVNGNPNLAVFPEGIAGLKPLPLRLQEGTVQRKHFYDHTKDLQKAGYDSAMQAIWDISQNYTKIYKGKKGGQIVLTRPTLIKEGNELRRGVLYAEFQEEASAYRVGSVTATKKMEYLEKRELLWEKTPSIRLHDGTSSAARTRELTGPQQPLHRDSVGESLGNVNQISRQLEFADDARLAQINREAMQIVEQMPDETLEMRGAKMALDDAPDLRVQVDELDGTMLASEYLAREKQAADELRQKAQQGVDVAVTCMFMNNGIGGAD